MGGVWCKTDKGSSYSSPKAPFTSTISRWTDHMRQAYRKPKKYPHRPPRPPQKPLRSNNRLTISHPQLMTEASSDGWRTATLMVPEAAPVPPPRKKRKRDQHLARAAYSMDELNRSEVLNQSEVSLPEKCISELNLNHRSSLTTILVTPVLESRTDQAAEEVTRQEEDKENVNISVKCKVEEEDEFPEEVPEEIIPIEKETLFSSRTVLHSNLGYIDKLSAISEVSTVSTESGFDDRTDVCKSSELSGSITSSDSITRESGLNILAHIQDINSVSQLNEANRDIREKTAISKKEWLQSILREEPDPLMILGDSGKGSEHQMLSERTIYGCGELNSSPSEHLHPVNREAVTSGADNGENKTPPPTPERHPSTLETAGANHSVLLELLQKNKIADEQLVTDNPFLHKQESIFLTDTKTNIIYKSLSSDNLTEVYDDDYIGNDNELIKKGPVLNEKKDDFVILSQKPYFTDVTFQAPISMESADRNINVSKEKQSDFLSSQIFKDSFSTVHNSTATDSKFAEKELSGSKPIVNGILSSSESSPSLEKLDKASGKTECNSKLCVKEALTQKESLSSSRRSSITDSLHEFEMSIYDMLNESKKNRESSDEEESLKIGKAETSKK